MRKPWGVTQCVMPQNWLFLGIYKKHREHLLKNVTWNLLALLGGGAEAFEDGPGNIINICMVILSFKTPNNEHTLKGIIASEPKTVPEKSEILENSKMEIVSQKMQLNNPDSRVILKESIDYPLLSEYADGLVGLQTSDDPMFLSAIWEHGSIDNNIWEYLQSTPEKYIEFTGQSWLVKWEKGKGLLLSLSTSRPTQGLKAIGKPGIAIHRMGDLFAYHYGKERFHQNVATIIPRDLAHLSAIYCYCSSTEYNEEVRQVDQALKVTNATLVKVPFDLERWTKIAQEKFPNGLPKPYSDDPTQWLFHGHPAPAEEPLQVAVARLLGYQWPAESDKEMELSDQAHEWIAKCESLASYVDDDGIVCLSPVRGEKAADERLEALLMAAFGEQWNAALRNKLLTDVQCSGKTLNFWLREKFFEQHCKLFQNRPFIWHIWDGLADGFNALVNYHQLDRQNLERLIYTYLGDWIRAQDHGVKEGIDGAVLRLQAAQILKTRLETILEGEAPYDIFVRWKSLAEQPLGWNPDINDGVRMNIRPFMAVPDVSKKEAGILRSKPNIKWTKDRGNDVASAPWYKLGLQYNESEGSRINDHHLSLAEKKAARDE